MRYICTSIVATLALVGTSFAATINVPGDHATIQGAIDASSNGDVIAIAAGTYNEHSLNTGGKAITIGSASGNLDVTIDANGDGSVFVFASGEGDDTVIKDLVITGGSNYYGGGIYCDDSSPTITDCTIQGNTANYRGGIYCDSSNPTISGGSICGNHPDQHYGCHLSSTPGTTIAPTCPKPPGDIDNDGDVDTDDLNALHDELGIELTDVNNNGCVDIDDLLYVIEDWGEGCSGL